MGYLFVHGWGTDSWVWERAAGELGGRDSLNIDLPGHGGELQWSTPDIAPAVEEIKKAAEGRKDRELIGVGWSLGAEALLALPPGVMKKFRALVLVGATPRFVSSDDFPWGQSPALVKRMIRDMRADPSETVSRFYALNFTEGEQELRRAVEFRARYRYPGPIRCVEGDDETPPGCYQTFRYGELTTALGALYETDLRDRLASVDVPTLVVHGGTDGVCPVGASEYLAEKIKGARLEVFEDAGHAPFLTEEERFIEKVREFAQKV